jgi:hypothetical protein
MRNNNADMGKLPPALIISETIVGSDPSTWPEGWQENAALVEGVAFVASERNKFGPKDIRETPTGHLLRLIPIEGEVVDDQKEEK